MKKIRALIVGIALMALAAYAYAAITIDPVTGAITLSKGTDFTTSTACAAGYTKVGVWCMDTDGTLATVRATQSASEGSYTSTVVNANAKMVMVHATALIAQDGSADVASLINCVIPGDSAVTACVGDGAVTAQANLASENDQSGMVVTVMAGATGNIKTRCLKTGAGSVAVIACNWFIVGYMP